MSRNISPTKCLLVTALISLTSLSAIAKTEYLNSGKVLKGDFPFSEAVKVNGTLYMSGLIGLTPGTGTLVPGGISAEAKQTMENTKAILEAHGYNLKDVVKCTAMLADMNEWQAFNEVYKTYFTAGKYPARSAFGTSGLALNARLELECIAVK